MRRLGKLHSRPLPTRIEIFIDIHEFAQLPLLLEIINNPIVVVFFSRVIFLRTFFPPGLFRGYCDLGGVGTVADRPLLPK